MNRTLRILHGYRMAYGDASNIWSFDVYECNGRWPDHSTIMSGHDVGTPNFAGRLGTRRLPAWMDKLPCGDNRIRTVGRFHRAQYRAAYKLILANLPRLFRHYRILSGCMGNLSIDVYEPRTGRHNVNLALS